MKLHDDGIACFSCSNNHSRLTNHHSACKRYSRDALQLPRVAVADNGAHTRDPASLKGELGIDRVGLAVLPTGQ